MKVYGYSDIGRRRKTNQDRFLIKDFGGGIFVLAVFDGMGGANGGEEASSAALSAFEECITGAITEAVEGGELITRTFADRALCAASKKANEAVIELSKVPELSGLGTTIVAALVTRDGVSALNIGDSRIYEAGRGSLRQISKDNSYVQYLVDIGQITQEEAAKHPQKNLITKCLGTDPDTEPDTYRLAFLPDMLLLCSDGLTNAVSDEDIYGIISSNEDVEAAVKALIDAANEAGSPDNVTVILAVNE